MDELKVNVFIETPKKSNALYKYNPILKTLEFKQKTHTGCKYSNDHIQQNDYNCGFIPNTLGPDGNPIEAMVIMDPVLYSGCYIECEIVGALKIPNKDNIIMVMCPSSEFYNFSYRTDVKPHYYFTSSVGVLTKACEWIGKEDASRTYAAYKFD